MKLIEMAYQVLLLAEGPLSYKQIWDNRREVIADDSEIEYKGNGEPWQVIYSSINQEITTKENPRFYKTSKNPVLFGLVEKNYANAVIEAAVSVEEDIEESVAAQQLDEDVDLHAILVKYLAGNQHFMCLTKTIERQKDQNFEKGLNEWIYPELIGVRFPFGDLRSETIRVLSTLLKNPVKIFSFEIQKKLTIGNLRNAYFQAVSNSSWAMEGYLVTQEIDDSEEFLQELALLNNAFGIGVIKLNTADPDQSTVLFQAAIKESLDVNMLNKLIDRSDEVRDVFRVVDESMKISRVSSRDIFDPVIEESTEKEIESAEDNSYKERFMGFLGRKK